MGSLKSLFVWLVPFPILFGATVLSLHFVTPKGGSLFYLPIALSIIFFHWWGWRVLPSIVLNSLVSLLVWDGPSFHHWPILIWHESATAFTSWFLFRKLIRGKIWLPNLRNTLLFIVLGILVPVGINSLFVFLLSKNTNLTTHTIMVLTADFSLSFTFCLPALYFVTPWLERYKIIEPIGAGANPARQTYEVVKSHRLEAFFSLCCLPALALFFPMEKFWFIYGIFNIYIALRFGFGHSLLANAIIFIILYVLPFLLPGISDFSWALETNVINVHLGMILLGVTACLIGCVVSDLRSAERKLTTQFQELAIAHHELDRFVYSASHDLIAPLKSIFGLVNISRLEQDEPTLKQCIDKIEKSALRLDRYIQEILYYSKNNRTSINLEPISLPLLHEEIMSDIRANANIPQVRMSQDFEIATVVADRFRLKLILHNLLLNALQYQRLDRHDGGEVKIFSTTAKSRIFITIVDNGQGMDGHILEKVFEMFYRGNTNSQGSGLGLYIAREAAIKMNGEITVTSKLGEGSAFTLALPKYVNTENSH